MGKIMSMIHHGVEVKGDTNLLGKHREYCLCWRCKKFNPKEPEKSCKIANLLFRVDIMCEITTPVFYCREFEGE